MPNGGWNQTHAWDEWYDHVEHVQRVQKGFIDDLNVEVVKLRHELRLLTAHVSLFTNNTVPNPISLSSAIPAPSSTPPWPLPNSPTTPDRECQHGMIGSFSENFTPAMFPEFHALHDGNDICSAMLQSAATKNDMQHSLLETSFRGCQDLRIERYGKKNQTVRFACTRCSRCTKEIEARKMDGNGGSVYSETDAEKKWFWRWLFAQILKVESLQHCTVHRDIFTLAAAPPPPPLPQQAIQNLVPDIVAPSETVVEVPSQTETVVEVSSENLLEASIVEPLVPDDIVEVQPVIEAAPTSSQEGDNGWNTDL